MDVAKLGLPDLPLDILLKIFSLLPLRAVLKLEHSCRTLQRAIAVHLSTLKCLNLYDGTVLQDEFLSFESNSNMCRAISDGSIARLMSRCPNVTTVTFLPARADVVSAIVELFRPQSIRELELCCSWKLAERLLRDCSHVSIGVLKLEGISEAVRLPPNCRVRRLDLRGVQLDEGLPSLSQTEEICLSRVTLHLPKVPENGDMLEFPMLRSFSFNGTTFARDRAHLHTSTVTLLTSLAAAPLLDTLRLSVGGFDELRAVCRVGGFPRLRRLDLACPVWHESSSPQQSAGAVVVAELCSLCRASLRHLSLPSVALVKQFYTFFLGHDVWFPVLETLEVNDKIYDTKFFLAPFNFVEDQVYNGFLQRFPQLSSLSLHSYSGSLKPGVLQLPVHLTHLTLPWDSRRPSTQSWADVASLVGSQTLLTYLHVAGVESVEGVSEAAKLSGKKDTSVIKLDSPTLEVVKVSNVCCSKIVLTGCTMLTRFALQCCPLLRSLALPSSVEGVSVYDEGRPYMMKFVEGWLSQLGRGGSKSTGHHHHLHVQLHSLHKAGTEVPSEMGKGLLPETVLGFSRSLNYVVLYRHSRKELHHSARESMYSCTEFQPQSDFNPGNLLGNVSPLDEVAEENEHRGLVARGISRWLRYFSAPPQVLTATDGRVAPPVAEKSEFEAMFCGQLYNCYTNMPALVEANASPYLTQPSSCSSSSSHEGGKGTKVLNVPRTGLCAAPLNGKPLVCVSVMEYLHHISHPRE